MSTRKQPKATAAPAQTAAQGGEPMMTLATAILVSLEALDDTAAFKGARKAFVDLVLDYEHGFIDAAEFIEGLGLRRNTSTKKQRFIDFRHKLIPDLVDVAARNGKPKTDPSIYPDTAFHAVADGFAAAGHALSPATVYDIYRGKRR